MRISLITAGTRGDTQPMVLLGSELERRGHDVVLGVSPNLVDFGTRAGLSTSSFGPDTQAFMESDSGRRWLASGNVSAFMKELGAISKAHLPRSIEQSAALVEGADVVVTGFLAEDPTQSFCDAARIPMISLHSAPMRPTRAYANPLVTTREFPGLLNRATGLLFERVWSRTFAAEIAALRSSLGLSPTKRSTAAQRNADASVELQAYSPALVPAPRDWGPNRPLVGFLTPTPELRKRLGEATPDPDLDTWLDAGDAPVFFGFGSMPILDPAATLAMVRLVAQRLGVRALVGAGWSRLDEDGAGDDQVRVVKAVDHDRVLPRCRAAVHHGGAGTTAAALLAGVPSLVCSVFADQPFWGKRLERLGAGAHLRLADLDAASLEQGLRAVMTPSTTDRAGEIGDRLRAEGDGTARTADEVEAAARLSRPA